MSRQARRERPDLNARETRMTKLSRRDVVTGSVALTAGSVLAATTISPAAAAAPPAGRQAPGFYRYKVGSIEITVVTDGVNKFKFADNHVTNKSRDEVNGALAAAYYEKDMMTTPYNPVVVNTGSKLVVIDLARAKRISRAARERPDNSTAISPPPASIATPSISWSSRISTATISTACSRPTTSSPSPMRRFWCPRPSGSTSWTTAR